MNFLELQDEVSDLVNFTTGVTDQDFTTAQIKKALNFRYKKEVAVGQQEGGRNWFKKIQSVTWPVNQITLVLPSQISRVGIIRIEDITSIDPGFEVMVSELGDYGDVFWLDNNTLQYGQTGPNEAKTLRFTYLARAAEMVSDDDVPELIPDELHMLLVWSAAAYLRLKADEAVPNGWMQELDEARLDFWKMVSRGRPLTNEPTITKPPDSESGFVY